LELLLFEARGSDLLYFLSLALIVLLSLLVFLQVREYFVSYLLISPLLAYESDTFWLRFHD
jgi:hypothetical protein